MTRACRCVSCSLPAVAAWFMGSCGNSRECVSQRLFVASNIFVQHVYVSTFPCMSSSEVPFITFASTITPEHVNEFHEIRPGLNFAIRPISIKFTQISC
jgi:hypothetical protein